MENQIKGNGMALLPLAVFILLFIGTAIVTNDFYSMPVILASLIAAGVALSMNRKENFMKKVEIFCKGAGNSNIILMILVFLLAGAFAATAEKIGAVDSIVNLGISILPPNLLIVGLFLIGCFISISMGTSMGTIVALAPIGIGIAEQTGVAPALALSAVIGGAMFGDNLSMISDTTIAAVRTQNTQMRDKFKVNFFIVLPAAIVTAVIYGIWTMGEQAVVSGEHAFEFITILPYLGVLVAAIAGVNVLVVLVSGVFFAGIVGLYNGSFGMSGLVSTVTEGIRGMEDLAMIALVIGGMIEVIKHNGGIQFVLDRILSRVKSRRGAEFGIAGLASVLDLSTANNTISIIMGGPLAKNISEEYGVDPRKSASILDIFSGSVQGMLPYGAQVLAAAGLASISPLALLPYSIYPILIAVAGIVAIMINYPSFERKEAKN
ncbi:Na+/H+ antiporter NhaC family protein [Alkalihalobacillus macyae]|uniref:Na+/H+ antiporter NhaC family protein n=1 Tax=Guptibacillus hwajinpoensis TaxID=208199 RepID=UPI00273AF217|nr:Na+/H+ antiporter NhaC family protein [Alkalihalobacillus macyae]MDP4552785.1 Na+/H+ antiporter NhaC family protein [Alkalihalobacillus macyae]